MNKTQLEALLTLIGDDDRPTTVRDPWAEWVGQNVLIRTVTMIQVGHLDAVSPDTLVLSDAAWVADTGRFNEALTSGDVGECEPFPDGRVLVGRGAVIDACLWSAPLLRSVK